MKIQWNQTLTMTLILLISFFGLGSAQAGYYHKLIDVSVMTDYDGRLNKYPLSSDRSKEKAYIMAKKGESYAIKIRNKSAQRIGVVIAVDGRNIISGKKSHLSHHERMYVLAPFESATYRGWRTGKNQVNEFFFTRAKHSYAGSFGDHSAMGVIAVAAFEEKSHQYRKKHHDSSTSRTKPHPRSNRRHSKQPGTGFGEEVYSPVVKVDFKPKQYAEFKSFLKYEWRHVLCKKGIISCHKNKPYNRFWDEDEDKYAPYPANWKRWSYSYQKH